MSYKSIDSVSKRTRKEERTASNMSHDTHISRGIKTHIPSLRIKKHHLQKLTSLYLMMLMIAQSIAGVFIYMPKENEAKATGTIYYVSQQATNGYVVGSDSNTGTSKENPKLTIAAACAVASSGDTIVLNDGTYATTGLSITKGITLNAENDYAVTISGGIVTMDIKVSDGSTFTLGKVIVDGLNTSMFGMLCHDGASIYSVVLNQTRIQNYLKTAIYGTTDLTKMNFTANGISISDMMVNQTGWFYGISFNSLVQGTIDIDGGTINTGVNGINRTIGGIFIVGNSNVSVRINNVTLNVQACPIANEAVIEVDNSPNAVVTHNTININDASGQNGAIDGIWIKSTGIDASNPVIAYNTITNNQSGLGRHLIIIGRDSSDPADISYRKVNNAKIYDNVVSGSDSNSANTHGILIGGQIGGEVYNNVINKAYIGVISKGSLNDIYYNNITKNITGQSLRAKASTGSKFYNNTTIITSTQSNADAMESDYDSGTGIASSGVEFKNNLIYSTIIPQKWILVGTTSDATFSSNSYYAPSESPFAYQSTTYSTFSSWKAAHETNAVWGDPLFTNYLGNDYTLTYPSPLIDSGTPISGITTDYLGNPIYGNPDIGAYEYQPPYSITSDNPNTSSPIRIYADGKYRYTGTTSGNNTAKLRITPQEGFATNDYSQWMDVNITTWNTTSDYYKKWTEESPNHNITTNHTIGDLSPHAPYILKVDGEEKGAYDADSNGQITFTYQGGYSQHTFEIEQKPSAAFISPTKPQTDNISINNDTTGTPTLTNLPDTITQIAVSTTKDFTNISWEDISKKEELLKQYIEQQKEIYIKFRTNDGAVSNTITYTPQTSNNPQNTDITLNDGDIVKTPSSPDIYVIKLANSKKYKRLILSPQVFNSYHHLKWDNIKTISEEQLSQYQTSTLVKELNDTIIYSLTPHGDQGQRKPFDLTQTYDPDSIYTINKVDRDSYEWEE